MSHLCGAIAGHCVCSRPTDHTDPHRCMAPDRNGTGCGGEWEDADGTFTIIQMPGGLEITDVINDLIGGGPR